MASKRLVDSRRLPRPERASAGRLGGIGTPRFLLVFLLLVWIAGAVGIGWFRWEGSPPELAGPDRVWIGAAPRVIPFELVDSGAGPREVRAVLRHARGEVELLRTQYPGNWLSGGSGGESARFDLVVDPSRLDLKSGDAFLRIVATDWSWRRNRTTREIPVVIDLEPPRIRVTSGYTNVRRGGTGAVGYRVSEATVRDGVRVGNLRFRGHRVGGAGPRTQAGLHFALFAVPEEAPAEAPIRVFAVDEAGNESEAQWPVFVREQSSPEVQVPLSRDFLDTKVRALARAENLAEADATETFRRVNTRVRRATELRIRDLLDGSSPQPLWHGRFGQLPRSKVMSPFGERRRYTIDGVPVSEAIHLGYDLASTAAARVPAANAGRVVFAGELGIYGNCVLVDHGLGLASLYGHLSRIDVKPDDRVEKGHALGLSGATGLAGGDHLHFAILVGGFYVDPIEWWDATWVRTHVEAQLVRSAP